MDALLRPPYTWQVGVKAHPCFYPRRDAGFGPSPTLTPAVPPYVALALALALEGEEESVEGRERDKTCPRRRLVLRVRPHWGFEPIFGYTWAVTLAPALLLLCPSRGPCPGFGFCCGLILSRPYHRFQSVSWPSLALIPVVVPATP